MEQIHAIIRAVMKEGAHYGTIPGTSKPTLLKPGAEVALSAFGLWPDCHIRVRELDDPGLEPGHCEVEVVVRVRRMLDGVQVGHGVGSASTLEERWRWRRAVSREEWEATPPDLRRERWRRVRNAIRRELQVAVNPYDVRNTVRKMAKKRALVDAALTTLGMSEVFTQDVEEMPEELRQETPNGGPLDERPISEAQLRRLYAIAREAGRSRDEVRARLREMGLERAAELKRSDYDAFVDWLRGEGGEAKEEER
jgi:Fe2+ transport system protein FeoA